MLELTNRLQIKEYLHQTHFHEYFSRDMSDHVQLFRFYKGEYLIKEGIISEYLYFLIDGEVQFTASGENGEIITLGGTNNFAVLGEVSSLWKMQPMSSVQALKNSICFGICLDRYREQLQSDTRFLQFVCHTLINRLSRQNDNLVSLLSSNYEDKVAACIIQNNENNLFTLSLKQCAKELGVSYRHLIRIMNHFLDKGYLVKIKKKYYISDYEDLYKMASDTYNYFD